MKTADENAMLDLLVGSGNIEDRKPSILLLNQSHGWLISAEWILQGSANSQDAKTPYHALPAMFAIYHGVELFLKGVTSELCQTYNSSSHNIKVLWQEYNCAVEKNSRLELKVKANLNRLIEWDESCDSHKAPHGSDFRFILDKDNKPYWPGIKIFYREVVDWSREYRREFSRIRRILFDIKGWSVVWEEGNFSSHYPDMPLWFFCMCGRFRHVKGSTQHEYPYEHDIIDRRGRTWRVYEGEAINSENFNMLSAGKLPQPNLRIQCAFNDLSDRLAEID